MEKPNPPSKDLIVRPMPIKNYPLRENVVGQAGEFIDDFIQSLDNKFLYGAMGVDVDRSFLLTGPPGNGKTLAVETLVNQVNKDKVNSFIKDPDSDMPNFTFLGFKYDTGRYGTAYINEGAKIVQKFFDVCFTVADKGIDTLIVFDEADSIFGKRNSSRGHKEDSKVLETIMKNMNDLQYMDNAYVVLMSNFPEAFDEASIRAGRIDQKYIFGNPGEAEREFAYRHAIKKVNAKARYNVIKSSRPKTLAEISNGFSYSDIVESVNSAVKNKAREVASRPKSEKIDLNIYLGQKDVRDAVMGHRAKFIKKEPRKIGF